MKKIKEVIIKIWNKKINRFTVYLWSFTLLLFLIWLVLGKFFMSNESFGWGVLIFGGYFLIWTILIFLFFMFYNKFYKTLIAIFIILILIRFGIEKYEKNKINKNIENGYNSFYNNEYNIRNEVIERYFIEQIAEDFHVGTAEIYNITKKDLLKRYSGLIEDDFKDISVDILKSYSDWKKLYNSFYRRNQKKLQTRDMFWLEKKMKELLNK